MSERVVDALEFVDIDIHDRQLFAGPDRFQRLLEPLAKQHTVRQVGQRVVMRHVGDLLVGTGARGNVFDHRQPPAALQGLVHDLDRATTRGLGQLTGGLAERDVADDGVAEFIDIAVKGSGLLAVRDQPLHGAARFDHLRRQSEHVEIGLVAGNDPRRCIIEHKALRNVVDGDRELTLLRRQPLARQSMVLQQQADDESEYDGHREQYAFAQAPVRNGDAKERDRRQPGAQGQTPHPSGPIGAIGRSGLQWMAVLEAHAFLPRHDIVTRDKWKRRYKLQLVISYRDTVRRPIRDRSRQP